MRISYKGAALADLTRTRDYIAGVLKNPRAAQKLMNEILHAVSLLEDNPEMGTPLNSRYDVETDLRFLVVSRQLVFYRISDKDTVTVVRVLDGRQDYLALLF